MTNALVVPMTPTQSAPVPALPTDHTLAVTMLKVAFAMTFAACAADWLFALVAGGDGWTLLVGAAFASLAAAGFAAPQRAARLLAPDTRVLAVAFALGIGGALDFGLQVHFPWAVSSTVGICVIVARKRVISAFVAVLFVGLMADALIGAPRGWMLGGGGRDLLVNQAVDLLATAVVIKLLVTVLRWFVARSRHSVTAVHAGGRSLTPQLALAVRRASVPELERADPAALVERLRRSERRVVELLADGLQPREIAATLTVELSTVRAHIKAAKRKTGARSMPQLVALYVSGHAG